MEMGKIKQSFHFSFVSLYMPAKVTHNSFEYLSMVPAHTDTDKPETTTCYTFTILAFVPAQWHCIA